MDYEKTKGKQWVVIWLCSGAALVFLMVVIGGITRLTGSGLSMSDWNLILGALPPMSERDWMAAFDQYKQFPEYRHVNYGMSLAEFKQIFFWEYLHRLLGRLIGLAFLIPFLFFWIRGFFDKKLLRRVLFLFVLGALQGAMGWIMVKSGLVDVPRVSHYRLALHFLLAVLLISFCLWFALDLAQKYSLKGGMPHARLGKWVGGIGVLFFLQGMWGAFTAGLDAGTVYNTFPLMNGGWVPHNAWVMNPAMFNLLENPGTVQWIHRILATLLAAAVIALWADTRLSGVQKRVKQKADIMLALILVQYTLGVLALVYYVPVVLGVLHQAGAVIFWAAVLVYYHQFRNLRTLPGESMQKFTRKEIS